MAKNKHKIEVYHCKDGIGGASLPSATPDEMQIIFMCEPRKKGGPPIQLVTCVPRDTRMGLAMKLLGLDGAEAHVKITYPDPPCYVCRKPSPRLSTTRPDGKTTCHAKCEPRPAGATK